MPTFHALITHADGEVDAADLEAHGWSTVDFQFKETYDHLLLPGDHVTITEEGDTTPTFEWTETPAPRSMAHALTLAIFAVNTLRHPESSSDEDVSTLLSYGDTLTEALADVRRNVRTEDEDEWGNALP